MPKGIRTSIRVLKGLGGPLSEKYKKGKSLKALSEETGLYVHNVRRAILLHDKNIKIRPSKSYKPKSKVPTEKVLEEFKKGLGSSDIGKKLGIHRTTVRRVLKKEGYKYPSRDLLDQKQRELVVKEYVKNPDSYKVAFDWGITENYVRKLVRRSGQKVVKKSNVKHPWRKKDSWVFRRRKQ